MKTLISVIEPIEEFTVENLQNVVKGWITENGIGFGKVMMPLRVSLVGSLQGPDLFEIMYLIGKNETIKRIGGAIS